MIKDPCGRFYQAIAVAYRKQLALAGACGASACRPRAGTWAGHPRGIQGCRPVPKASTPGRPGRMGQPDHPARDRACFSGRARHRARSRSMRTMTPVFRPMRAGSQIAARPGDGAYGQPLFRDRGRHSVQAQNDFITASRLNKTRSALDLALQHTRQGSFEGRPFTSDFSARGPLMEAQNICARRRRWRPRATVTLPFASPRHAISTFRRRPSIGSDDLAPRRHGGPAQDRPGQYVNPAPDPVL
jgi:hypothetical protein